MVDSTDKTNLQIDESRQGKTDSIPVKSVPARKDSALLDAVVEANKQTSIHRKSKVPRLDLAQQIMAGQRRNTAEKRQSPTEKSHPQKQMPEIEHLNYAAAESPSQAKERNQIIAEIVARDITRLYNRGTKSI